MKTRITLEVNTKIYNKVLWMINQFKSEELQIVDEYAEGNEQIRLINEGGSEYRGDKLLRLLQDIEVEFEDISEAVLV